MWMTIDAFCFDWTVCVGNTLLVPGEPPPPHDASANAMRMQRRFIE
jgi:hypothetical protein